MATEAQALYALLAKRKAQMAGKKRKRVIPDEFYEPGDGGLPWGRRGRQPANEPAIKRMQRALGALKAAKQTMDLDNWRETLYPQQFGPGGSMRPDPIIGPAGDDLPPGALSWDANGNPFYGEGFTGWARQHYFKTFFPTAKATAGETLAELDETRLPPYVAARARTGAIQPKQYDLGRTLANAWRNNISGSYAPTGMAVRGIQEFLGGALEALNVPAIKAEQTLSLAQELAGWRPKKGLSGTVALRKANTLPPYVQARMRAGGFDVPQQTVVDLSQTIKNFINGEWEYRKPVYASKDPFPVDASRENLKAAWEAGRILYTTWWEGPGKRDEFMRRYKAGESPTLLARELENPWAEAAGQVVLDPLNWIPAKATGNVAKILNISDDMVKPVREIAGVFDEAGISDDVLRTLGENKAAELFEMTVKGQQAASKRIAQGLEAAGKDYRITALTSAGKKFVQSRRFGTVVDWLAANADNPEEALDYLTAMVKMHSDDPMEVGEAISTLRHLRDTGRATLTVGQRLGPNVIFSEAGETTGYLLRKLLVDAKGEINYKALLDELAELGNDLPKLAEAVGKRVDNVLDEMFPTVDEILKSKARVAAGTADARALTWAERADKLPEYVKLANRLAHTVEPIYAPLNRFFAAVYMGMSPGYAFRNFVTNEFHVAVDQGVGAIFNSMPQAIDDVKFWLGGQLNKGIRGFGKGLMGAPVEQTGLAYKLSFAQRWAEKFEELAAAQVSAASIQRTMRTMLKPGRALPDMKPLLDAGLSQEAADHLVGLVAKHGGDVRKATGEFMRGLKLRKWDAMETLLWVAEKDRKALADFGIDKALQDVIDAQRKKGATVEDAIRAVRKEVRDKLRAQAKTTEAATPVLADDDVAKATIEGLSVANAKGDVNDSFLWDATHYTAANHNSNVYHIKAIRLAYQDALSKTADLSPEAVTGLRTLGQRVEALQDGNLVGPVQKVVKTRLDNALLYRDASFEKKFDIAKAWKELELPGDPVTDVREFRQALWEQYYFEYARTAWSKYRDDVYLEAGKLFDEIKAIVPGVHDGDMLAAEPHYLLAKRWDRVLREDQVRLPLARAINRGDNVGAARIIARQFGLPTAVEGKAGNVIPINDDALLRIVQKYAKDGDTYTDLRNTPPGAVKDAFIRKMMADVGIKPRASDTLFKTALPDDIASARRMAILEGDINALPAHVQTIVKAEAKRLADELSAGGVSLIPAPEPQFTGQMIRASSNPDWYKQMYAGGFKDRQQAIKTLEAIANGQAQKNKYYSHFRGMILDNTSAEVEMSVYLGEYEQAAEQLAKMMDDENFLPYEMLSLPEDQIDALLSGTFQSILDGEIDAAPHVKAMARMQHLDDVIARLTGITPKIGAEEAHALGALIEANARYLGITPDEWVDNYLFGVGGLGDEIGLKGETLFKTGPMWYSQLERTIDGISQEKMTVDQLRGAIQKGAIKADELKWSGLDDWLKGKNGSDKVTKQEIVDLLDKNHVNITEVLKEEGAIPPPIMWQDRAYSYYDNASLRRDDRGYVVQYYDDGWQMRIFQNEKEATDLLEAKGIKQKIENYIEGDNGWRIRQLPGGYRLDSPSGNHWILDTLDDAKAFADEQQAVSQQGTTQYGSYVLPGGENYRELLLTFPKTDEYRSAHWSEPNVLAHVRFNDRVDVDGKKVLFIEEIQSDWHQAGREKGYATGDLADAKREYEALRNRPGGIGGLPPTDPDRQRADELLAIINGRGNTVPDAPFSKTWPELTMKRMMRWAADNDYDRIAWTSGTQQAARYDLSKQVDSLRWREYTEPGREGMGQLVAFKGGEIKFEEISISKNKLSDYIGKQAADNLLNAPADEKGMKWIAGEQLAVGGTGMLKFYDEMLPEAVNKYAKKWGVRVGKTTVDNNLVHSLDVTQAMKESVLQGQPLFKGGKLASVDFLDDGKAIIRALTKKTNVADMAHELGHVFRRTLKVEDLAKAEKAIGVTDGKWLVGHEEDFSKQFEIYLREGEAPTPELAGVFERFKKWLSDIYKVLRGEMKLEPNKELREVFDTMLGKQIPTPHISDAPPTPARVIEQSADGLNDLFKRIEQGLKDNWRDVKVMGEGGQDAARIGASVEAWSRDAYARVAEARLMAAKVADHARDFTLLSYPEKTYADLAAAHVYPYHFWYNRTYANWMKRAVENPVVLANYARYRNAMSKENADAPEWWRYNLNLSEMLGIDTDNPLYFNLEATINPLNGLTGVDFNDPYKRVNWWANVLDDMGKLGPSIFTPYNWAVALALKAEGEDDAASRWGGRLIPQTATLKAALTMMGAELGTEAMKEKGGANEFDLGVWAWSGGMDSYERRRVGRALYAMVAEGIVSPEEAMEAARTQKGELWAQATERAIKQRGPGQVASYLFGVGFKARTETDMQIDMFDQQWRMLMAMRRANLTSPDQFRDLMDTLREKYPFMDAVILSRYAGLDRDRSYAYNVLGRIPPGQKDDVAELVGITGDMIQKFWDSKGDLESWAETDRQRFMAGIVDIGAMLAIPDSATKAEWNAAIDAYDTIDAEITDRWGEDIQEKIDAYFFLRRTNADAANEFLDAHPEVDMALSYKDSRLINSPAAPYYASLQTYERYYKGLMYDALEKQFGDMSDVWDGLDDAKLEGSKAEKAYRKAHPEIDAYYDMRDVWEQLFNEALVRAAKNIQEPEFPELRGVPESLGQQDLYAGIQEDEESIYDLTWEDAASEMSPALERLVLDHLTNDEPLSYAARRQLEYIAENMGIDDVDLLLEILQQDLLAQ